MFEIYKIKNPDKEEYSSGLRHGYVQTSKRGKSWDNIGYVKNHLIQTLRHDKKAFGWYDNWDVLKITENGYEVIGKVKDFRIKEI